MCIILHNLLVRQERDDVPEDWIDKDDQSDMDDDDRAPSLSGDDDLNLPVPEDAPNDERRQQLTTFFNEFFIGWDPDVGGQMDFTEA